MVTVDAQSFLVVVAVAALAATAAGLVSRRLFVPVVVLEIVLGIVVGPDVADLAQPDEFIRFFSNLGLGMLFFFAGYEIDFERIRGAPLKLAAIGWAISLALAYTFGGLLALAGVVLSLLYTGSAMATTAIGTLIPILGDAGELQTRFGTYLLGAGAIGEFGPIVLITILFSSQSPASSVAVLAAFIATTVVVARDRSALPGPRVGDARALARKLEPDGDPSGGRARLRARSARDRTRARSATRRVRRRDHPAACASRTRGEHPRIEADRRRLRLSDPVLLRRQRTRASISAPSPKTRSSY